MFKIRKSKGINFGKLTEEVKDLYYEIPVIKQRQRKRLFFKTLKYFFIGIIILFVLIIFWLLLNYNNLRSIYQSAISGKNNAAYSVSLMKEKKFEGANDFANLAVIDFNNAKMDFKKYQDNFWLSNFTIFKHEVNNFAYLINSGLELSRALEKISQLSIDLGWFLKRDYVSFTRLNTKEKTSLLAKIYQSTSQIEDIEKNIENGASNLEKINYNGLLLPFKSKILYLKKEVDNAYAIVKEVTPLSRIIPIFLGYPQKSTYLLILQNNYELRPTGGFIGTYGILQMENGEVIRSDTHDIYHMDMPVKDKFKIIPPAPLKKYLGVDFWYMRDANWSPDWPTSAKQIAWFYDQENKLLPPINQINNFDGEFDGIIAITPLLITSLLEFIGPIYVENQEYNSSNFTDLLEYRVEKGYVQLGVPSWHRKEVIGEILKVLEAKLLDLPPNQMLAVFEIIEENLTAKNILLSFNNNNLQAIADKQNWSGKILPNTDDYLMIVDANMASFKTDAVISRGFDYKIRSQRGDYIAELKINYNHKGKYDWRTTKYRTYTRIYVPFGSQLLKLEGDSSNQIEIYNEFNKTVFGVFFEVDPGQAGNLRLYYKLPKNIVNKINSGEYNLTVQKQPGVSYDYRTFDLLFNNGIKSYSMPFGIAAKLSENHVKIENKENIDLYCKISF